MQNFNIEITTDEIRNAWNAIQAGTDPLKQSALSSYISTKWRGSVVDKFVGCSGEQMQGWLAEGFYPEGDGADIFGMSDAEILSPTMAWDEDEGDLFIESAIAGDDMPYARWEGDSARKGMKIRACFDTNCGTDANVLGQYFAWILKMIDACEAKGIAPDVELFIEAKGSFTKNRGTFMLTIPVVKAGEIVDAVAWRAFLSNGGFRSLGFLAIGLAANKLKDTVTSGLGQAVGNKFDVTVDADDVMTIKCPGHFSSFPEAEMTAKAEAAFDAAK